VQFDSNLVNMGDDCTCLHAGSHKMLSIPQHFFSQPGSSGTVEAHILMYAEF